MTKTPEQIIMTERVKTVAQEVEDAFWAVVSSQVSGGYLRRLRPDTGVSILHGLQECGEPLGRL